MKRFTGIVLGSLLLVVVNFSVFAEEHSSEMMDKGMMSKSMMGKGMMQMMVKKQLVATEDGGVVLLLGNKLVKYDKKLNLVKEVELSIDSEGMRQMMKEMMKSCPMMGKDDAGQGRKNSEKEMPSGHEAHH
ncbi:MAG: hypothetical protein K9L86_04330 [Candidatus Omnitrophica bacterium]|nr:hypothetical protein [Candidatus Omnitrophota bacterium]